MSEPKKRGRPKGSYKHHYKKQYAADLIAHMEKGYSFESFAGVMRCGIFVLYRWVDENKDFSDAKLVGHGLAMLFWEKLAVKGSVYVKDGPRVDAAIWRMNMKNRFNWHDAQKIEHEVTKSDSKLVIDLSGNFKKDDDKEKKK